MISFKDFRIYLLLGTIVGAILFIAYDHFQRRGLLIAQSANRTEHLVSHDLSIQMDHLNQVVEKLEQLCPPFSPCTFEARQIRQDLIQIWQNNRKTLKQLAKQKNFDPVVDQLQTISKRAQDFINKNGNSNSKLKENLESQFEVSQKAQETVNKTQTKYKEILKIQNKYQNNPFLRFFLNQAKNDH